jgi:hypothetical protein
MRVSPAANWRDFQPSGTQNPLFSPFHLTCGYSLVDIPISRGLPGDGSLTAMLGERKSNYAGFLGVHRGLRGVINDHPHECAG